MGMSLIFMVIIIVVLLSRVKQGGSGRKRNPNERGAFGSHAANVRKSFGSAKSVSDKNKSFTSKWHSETIPGTGLFKRPARTSDGHMLSEEQDITCRQYGHNHPSWEEPAVRYPQSDTLFTMILRKDSLSSTERKCGSRKRTSTKTPFNTVFFDGAAASRRLRFDYCENKSSSRL